MAEANSPASHIEDGEDSLSQQLLACDAAFRVGSENVEINLTKTDPPSVKKKVKFNQPRREKWKKQIARPHTLKTVKTEVSSQQRLACDAGFREGSDNLQINLNNPDPSSAQKTGECSEESVALINPAPSVTERRENNTENQEQIITGKDITPPSHQNVNCVMSRGAFCLFSFVITCLLAIAILIVVFPWKQS